MYKNYIFDLYGTLIDINTDEEDPALWKTLALLYSYKNAVYTPEELKLLYGKLVAEEKELQQKQHPEHTYIDIKIECVFEKLFSLKNICYTSEEIHCIASCFRSVSTKYIKLYDGVSDLLRTLKKQDKKLYLLSNAQDAFTSNEIKMFGLLSYFDGLMLSSESGICKPDPAFFDCLFQKYELNKQDSVMIGNDYISDIQGAYDFGIDSLYIHQSISPDIKGELKSKWAVMDGDVYKIKTLIIDGK